MAQTEPDYACIESLKSILKKKKSIRIPPSTIGKIVRVQSELFLIVVTAIELFMMVSVFTVVLITVKSVTKTACCHTCIVLWCYGLVVCRSEWLLCFNNDTRVI